MKFLTDNRKYNFNIEKDSEVLSFIHLRNMID